LWALLSAFALTVVGLTFVMAPIAQAAQPTGSLIPQGEEGAGVFVDGTEGAWRYNVGPIINSANPMDQAFTEADILGLTAGITDLSRPYTITYTPPTQTFLLKGDSLAALGAMVQIANGFMYSPDPDWVESFIGAGADDTSGAEEITVGWLSGHDDCASQYGLDVIAEKNPQGKEVVLNAWCHDPGVFQLTITKVNVVDASNYLVTNNYGFGTSWWKNSPVPMPTGWDPSAVQLAGPGSTTWPTPGSGTTVGVSDGSIWQLVSVLDPGLGLTKQVCAKTDGSCDPETEEGWVDSTQAEPHQIAYQQGTVQWRLTAQNTGNIALTNVHVAQDVTQSTEAADGAFTTDCAAGLFPDLAPGASASIACTTELDDAIQGTLVNTATLNARFDDTILGPDGAPLLNRFTGNPTALSPAGEAHTVPSNQAQAAVEEPAPAISLDKYVCATSDKVCAVPAGAAPTLDAIVANGWVKAASLPYDATATWLLVVTNQGNTRLDQIQLSREDLTAGGQGYGATDCLALAQEADLGSLSPGQSKTLTCQTEAVTADAADAVVNTAQAQGRATDNNGQPLPGADGGVYTVVESDESAAEVSTAPPAPGLTLQKYVCATGSDCAAPTTATLQALQSGLGQGQTIGGWTKATTVDYNDSVTWLLVYVNTGNTSLANITLTREDLAAGSPDHGVNTCQNGLTLSGVILPPQGIAYSICSTNDIRSTNALDGYWQGAGLAAQDKPVINTAQAQGTPVTSAGVGLPDPKGAGNIPPVSSVPSDAAVRADVVPPASITVEKYDCAATGCGEDGQGWQAGDYDEAYKVLTADQATRIRFKVTNDGEVALQPVVVSDATLEGTPVTQLSCDFSQWGANPGLTLNQPFEPGDSFYCTGALAGLPAGQNHSDQVTVTAVDPIDGGVVSDSDQWHGYVPDPSLALDKYVCSKFEGQICALPSPAALQGATLADLPALFAAEGWTDQTVAPYGQDANWLLVIKNTGNTALSGLTLAKEQITAGYNLSDGCREGRSDAGLTDLLPGEFLTVGCTTNSITAHGDDWVVNQARVSAVPMVAADPDPTKPLVPLTDGQGDKVVVQSNEDEARVQTVVYTPQGEVQKYDLLSGDAASGDFDQAPGRVLAAGQSPVVYLTFANTGNAPLSDILVTDRPADGSQALVGLSCDFSVVGGPAVGTAWDGPLEPGGSFTCSGQLPALEAGQSHQDNATVSFSYDGQYHQVTDPWNAYVPDPGLALDKWVCDKADGCALPTGATLTALAQGTPTGGWVNRATIALGQTAEWVIVVSNTGNVPLSQVTVSDALAEDSWWGHGDTHCDNVPPFGLGAGQAVAWRCWTTNITNQAAHGPDPDRLAADEDVVVNWAQAQATPLGPDGQPLTDPDGQPLPPLEADDWAAVNAVGAPALALGKWVCQQGTGCLEPTGADLEDLTNGLPAGGWVKTTEVAYGSPAQWMLLVVNQGDVRLADVSLTTETMAEGGPDHGPNSGFCVPGHNLGSLAPGEAKVLSCQTDNIRNTAALALWDDADTPATQKPVVNTAAAQGLPVGADGARLTDLNGDLWPAIDSQTSAAAVNTVKPPASIDIEKYSDDDPVVGDFDDAAKPLAPGTATPITLTISNDGSEPLLGVQVTDSLTAGAGPIAGLSCDFSALTDASGQAGPKTGLSWYGPLQPGDGFECSGTVPALEAGQSHSDVAQVTAISLKNGQFVSDDDPWNGLVAAPGLSLEKWVCGAAACSADEPAPVLEQLAAGQPADGWVKAAQVAWQTDARWLLVITNTGNTPLTGVALVKESVTGEGHGDSGDCAVEPTLTLLPGERLTVTCSTREITNSQAFGSSQDVVNTAQAAAVPVDDDGRPLLPDSGDGPGTVTSDDSSAEVRAEPPTPDVNIAKYDLVDGVVGHYDQAPGHLVPAGEDIPIGFTVTNSGDEPLVNLRVSDQTTAGEPISNLSCDFSTAGGPATGLAWSGPMAPGAVFQCAGVIKAPPTGSVLADTASVSADGQGTGQPVGDDDSWNGQVFHPELTLHKWVCRTGVGCATPDQADLAALAEGRPAGGWVKTTTVEYQGSAQWLIVLANSGDVTLTDVTLTKEDLTGGGFGDTSGSCIAGFSIARLTPGQIKTIQCQTADITNTAAFDAGAVTNIAQAEAVPVDEDDQPLLPGGDGPGTVPSGEDSAQVNTDEPPDEPTVEPSDEPTSNVTPEPTPTPTPEPSDEPTTPEPSDEPTPTEEPTTPAPTDEPTPPDTTPTPHDVTPTPTQDGSPVPTPSATALAGTGARSSAGLLAGAMGVLVIGLIVSGVGLVGRSRSRSR
jgi:uncharacterized repeat protein (TIGR01451 family)